MEAFALPVPHSHEKSNDVAKSGAPSLEHWKTELAAEVKSVFWTYYPLLRRLQWKRWLPGLRENLVCKDNRIFLPWHEPLSMRAVLLVKKTMCVI